MKRNRDLYLLKFHIFKVNPSMINRRFSYTELVEKYGSLHTISDFIIDGDWDNCGLKLCEHPFYKFIERVNLSNNFAESYSQEDKDNKQRHLLYENTYNSIKKNGYDISKINHHIRVAIGRTGEILFVDGIHRLSIIKVLGKEKLIPVQVAMIHKDFAENNSLDINSIKIKIFKNA